ncbi:hypothetical protein BREU_3922 [Bifidobacterium reuteri DSM 23975]|uniref:Uncharacterized protein n=1 Tax=Bifidobacterium reuteri DSM 23975 TaxID=1437610 RepID=A0A087CMH2_9BIFI|nr:hypothetical protein BREU_3922 [Bifidobacterium reuteri DSM 23975]
MVKTAAGTPCGITERLGAHCQGATGCSTAMRGGPLVVTLRAGFGPLTYATAVAPFSELCNRVANLADIGTAKPCGFAVFLCFAFRFPALTAHHFQRHKQSI